MQFMDKYSMENVAAITKPTQFSSYTRESNAKIVFSRIPTFEFTTQKFVLPGISLGTVQMNGRTGRYSRPGDVIEFEKPWQLEIILDEQYIAYQEIYEWLMVFADTEDETIREMGKITSDARIIVFDNNSKEIGSVHFHDVYPIAIGSIQYNVTDSGVSYMKFNANFDYSIFKIDFSKDHDCSKI